MSLDELAPIYLAALEEELRRVVGSEPIHQRAYHAALNADPDRGLPLNSSLSEYYAMLEYHLGWIENQNRDGQAGKRLRPLLCLLCCAAVAEGTWATALPLAAAIELLHNFTLIHDDIQDNSPLRRGRPTVWRKWGQAQAINAGDAMFTIAHLAVHGLTERGAPPELVLAVLGEFDQTCLVLTQGQNLDMAFEQRARVTVAEYLMMIEKKTAALIAASTHLGAKLAGAEGERLAHFYGYGLNLGLAFQIQDDFLGIWGDPEVTGKSAVSDLEKRKKSLPVVYGLEHSEEFARAYAQPPQPGQPVKELAATLERIGARTYIEQKVQATIRSALKHLSAAQPVEPAGTALRQLTDQLLHRSL